MAPAQHVDVDAIEQATGSVLRSLAGGAEPGPPAVAFLAARYAIDGRRDLVARLGVALASALERPKLAESADAAEWAIVFAAAATLSDDVRLRSVTSDIVDALLSAWPSVRYVDEASRSVEACLAAVPLLDRQGLLAATIDRLEQFVGAAYQPGDGMSHDLEGSGASGGAPDQVRTASALLGAFSLTGRTPYAMLADELMQVALRGAESWPVAMACEAARVLCRLARLHQDDEYRRAAVVAPGADHGGRAEHLLASAMAQADWSGTDAPACGLALIEWVGLQSQTHLWRATRPV